MIRSETDYIAEARLEMLNESSLSRLWSKTQNHTCGVITGFRDENTKSQNKGNNREIVNYLQSKGYSLTKVKGSYIENFGSAEQKEVSEPSFFVCNQNVDGDDGGQLERDLRTLGKRFDQDSVLIIPHGGKGAYLVGTSNRPNSFPPFGKKEVVGSGRFGKAAGEFLSRVKGRKFAFESVPTPGTINGKRGQKILAQRIDEEEEEETSSPSNQMTEAYIMGVREAIDALEARLTKKELKKIGPDMSRLAVEAIRSGDLTPDEAAANIKNVIANLM